MSKQWTLLIISLPGKSATPRMRIWRALKAGGAGIMRDGVYVLPHTGAHRTLFETQAEEVRVLGGTAYLVEHQATSQTECAEMQALFDRATEYAAWHDNAAALKKHLAQLTEARARREQSQVRRELEAIIATDFFAGSQRNLAEQTLSEIEHDLNRLFSPGEPGTSHSAITRRELREFTGRCWATRANLWVDRVASAWLIKRFIDNDATFVWLGNVDDCPPDAVGFDFDGAAFTHVDRQVTFEVLAQSFQLHTDVALHQIGELVRYLDVGGAPVAEAAGLLALLAGAREHSAGDDEFLKRASELFDHLYTAYRQQSGN